MSKREEEKAREYEDSLDYYQYTSDNPSVAYKAGYEQAESETIERACVWLFAHLPILVDYYNEDIHEQADRSEFIKLFRKQMEEEK